MFKCSVKSFGLYGIWSRDPAHGCRRYTWIIEGRYDLETDQFYIFSKLLWHILFNSVHADTLKVSFQLNYSDRGLFNDLLFQYREITLFTNYNHKIMFHTESEIFIKRTLGGFLEFCVVVFIIIILSKRRTMPKYHLFSSLLWKFLTISSWHACKSKWLWIILSIFYDLFSI